MKWAAGDEATWMRVPRGGGDAQPVSVRILKIFETSQRTMAMVETPSAGTACVRLSRLLKKGKQ